MSDLATTLASSDLVAAMSMSDDPRFIGLLLNAELAACLVRAGTDVDGNDEDPVVLRRAFLQAVMDLNSYVSEHTDCAVSDYQARLKEMM